MKARKFISLLLLTAYLFATAGTAVLSVTCKCVAMKARAEQHLCCSHCQLPDHTQPADGEFRAHCCNLPHSTEIELYTSSNPDDSEKYVRCIVAELPPSMAAECVQPLSFAVSSGNEILRKQPLPQDVVLSIRGLRAPPALA